MVAPAGILFVEQEDLDDTGLEADRWQFTYRLAEPALTAGQGFTVYFDEALYRNLTLDTVPSGWDVAVVQPDLVLPDAGFLDALTLEDALAPSGPFRLTLDWLGTGLPPMQPFEIYTLDGGFAILESGLTVPEPAETAVVFGLGLFAAGWWIRRRRTAPALA